MKHATPVLLFLLVVCAFPGFAQSNATQPPNQLVLPPGNHVLPLQWKGDSLHGIWEPHAALLIPVYLPGCPRRFYMQFDTGSPYSLFYSNKLTAIHRKYPAIKNLQNLRDTLTHIDVKAGKLTIHANAIAVQQFDSTGINWANKHNLEIIGTLGTDLIDNKVVVIDYPQQKLWIGDSMPTVFNQPFQPTPFMFVMRRILLPVTLLNKKTILYFDSGTSAFELLTDKATCFKLTTDTSATIQYPVQSWNKTLIANTVTSRDSLLIATITIPLHQVTWIEGGSAAQINQMMKMGIGGMTGNKLFLRYALLLDTKHQQAGLFKRE